MKALLRVCLPLKMSARKATMIKAVKVQAMMGIQVGKQQGQVTHPAQLMGQMKLTSQHLQMQFQMTTQVIRIKSEIVFLEMSVKAIFNFLAVPLLANVTLVQLAYIYETHPLELVNLHIHYFLAVLALILLVLVLLLCKRASISTEMVRFNTVQKVSLKQLNKRSKEYTMKKLDQLQASKQFKQWRAEKDSQETKQANADDLNDINALLKSLSEQ